MRYIILVCILFSFSISYSQRIINGKIIGEDGKALEGVTIDINQENRFVVSDTLGRFQFNPTHYYGVITASHVGYQRAMLEYNSETSYLNLTLIPDRHQLEEVEVNTGYQQIPKERATGSFVQIDNEQLTRRITTNVLERLDGIAPGLQFDNRSESSVKLNIRGINTMSDALMQPLIVVDNFPYEGDLNAINPNDVESVTLLKDAAATSIWGARAGNGVIVINMKKPLDDQGFKVSVTVNSTIGEKPDLYYYQRMNSSDFIDTEMMLFNKDFYNSNLNGTNVHKYVFSPVVDLLHQHSIGKLTEAEAINEIDRYRAIDYRDDMQKYFYRSSINQQYNINLAGGSNKTAYRVSIGFDDNRGDKVGSGLKRYTIRSSNIIKPTDRFTIQTTLGYTQSENIYSAGFQDYPIVTGGGKTHLYPYAKLVNNSAEALATPFTYNIHYVDTIGNGRLLDWKFKPYDEITNSSGTTNAHHFTANLNLNYELLKGINFEALYAFQKETSKNQTIRSERSFYTRNLINQFTQIDGESVKYIIPVGGIVNASNSEMQSHKARVQLSLDRTFYDKHALTVFLGSEISHRPSSSEGFNAYGYNEHLLTTQHVDYVNAYPIYDGLTSNSRIPFAGGFDSRVQRYVSLYGNGAYTYDKRFIASLSARRDASNLFGVKINDKWNPLWSVGLSWIVTEESFMKSLKWLDFLKVRSTYGHSGNAGGVASTLPIISHSATLSSTAMTNLPRALVSALPNPYLKWEDVRMVNYAIDFSFLNRKISGTFEYYTKKSADLISADALDPTTGFNNITSNIGMIRGHGFDFQINSKNIDRVFKWNTTFLLSKNKDKVKKFHGTMSSTLTYAAYSGSSLRPIQDKLLYPVFSYRSAGLDTESGDPQGYMQGELSKDYSKLLTDSLQNLNYHGTGLPPYYGSFQNTFRWKQLELMFNITYKFGHFFQKETINYHALFNSWITHGDYVTRWQQPGDEKQTTVPSMVYPSNANRDNFYAYSDANIERGDLIRLKDIRFAYSFVPRWGHKVMPVSVYFTANNVGRLWTANKSGIDSDYRALPAPRSYSLGLSASF